MPQTYFQTSKPPAKRKKLEPAGDFNLSIEHNSVLKMVRKSFKPETLTGPVVVAAFDLDGTLITTKSGATFARNGDDWTFLPDAPAKLTAKLANLPADRLVTVIFTNQGGVIPDTASKSFVNIRTKLVGAASNLPQVDVVLASLKISDPALKAKYRKPGSGMFEILKSVLGELEVDMDKSFYVGDAAGRQRDHSADDKGFASNAKLTFYTPEEYFNEPEPLIETNNSETVKEKVNDAPKEELKEDNDVEHNLDESTETQNGG